MPHFLPGSNYGGTTSLGPVTLQLLGQNHSLANTLAAGDPDPTSPHYHMVPALSPSHRLSLSHSLPAQVYPYLSSAVADSAQRLSRVKERG